MCGEKTKATDFVYSFLYLSIQSVKTDVYTPKLFVCHIQHVRSNIRLADLRQCP